jgi:hypothetical protein
MAASEGYGFVPLPDAVHREHRPQACFDRRVEGTARLTLELSYRVVQPIHVGAGYWKLNGRTPVRMAARCGARLAIPGSSMKGLLRARYEAITKSCCVGRAPKNTRLSNTLPSRTYPNHQVVFDDAIRAHPIFSNCRSKSGSLCAACALFGAMSLRGRVSFRDLLTPDGTVCELARLPKRFSPRPHHLGWFEVDERREQLRVTKLRGRKFYRGSLTHSDAGYDLAEVIPSGTELTGSVVCTNITAAELGGLLTALGFQPAAQPPSQLRVGAAKAYAFGRIDAVRVGVVPGPQPEDLPDGCLETAQEKFETSADHHRTGQDWLVRISGGPS